MKKIVVKIALAMATTIVATGSMAFAQCANDEPRGEGRTVVYRGYLVAPGEPVYHRCPDFTHAVWMNGRLALTSAQQSRLEAIWSEFEEARSRLYSEMTAFTARMYTARRNGDRETLDTLREKMTMQAFPRAFGHTTETMNARVRDVLNEEQRTIYQAHLRSDCRRDRVEETVRPDAGAVRNRRPAVE